MEAITIKQLAEESARLVKVGYGDKKILITSDDEANGTHELFQLFTKMGEDEGMLPLPFGVSEEDAINNYLVLG